MNTQIGYTLDPDEKVIRHIYHHWIDIAATASMSAVMILVALSLAYFYGRYAYVLPPAIPGWTIGVIIMMFIVLAVLILIVGIWVYRRNYLLLTTKHLIQVEQHGLFTSQVDQVSLGRIQDVSGKQPGVLATLLGFGTVTIQSAGEQRQFIFPHVPEPQEIADYILAAHEQFLREHPGSAD